MRRARILINRREAGVFEELERGKSYRFSYKPDYVGQPVSLTMPATQQVYTFTEFPAFFDGLLPEGWQLEGLLRLRKLDKTDFFGQLIAVGDDLVGAVTVKEISLK